MSRFSKRKEAPRQDTVNRAGGAAFSQSPELALASLLLTSFVKDQYYRSGEAQIDDVKRLVPLVDLEYAAKAAVFARTEYGMRTVSHVTAGEIGKYVGKDALNMGDGVSGGGGPHWGRLFYDAVVFRPDDMVEILAYWIDEVGRRPIPNAMKKGFANALQRFDEYQLGKYRKADKKVSLVDVVNLVHPRSTPAINALVNDELRQKDTWESKLSGAGNADDVKAAKAEAWEDLIRSGKASYFAVLKNLRNMEQQADPQTLQSALTILTSPHRVRKSKVLPFRFTTAYEQVSQRATKEAISRAVDLSLDNVPTLPGSTLVAIDGSGSMSGQPAQIASLFGAALYKGNDADLIVFDTRRQDLSPDPAGSVLGIQQMIMEKVRWGGTDFSLVFDNTQKRYDRIIILSDMQAWVTPAYYSGYIPRRDVPGRFDVPERFADYCKRVNHRPHLYCFDLAGYGDMQFPEDRVYSLAGFSEKVFDLIPLLEDGLDTLVDRINAVELTP